MIPSFPTSSESGLSRGSSINDPLHEFGAAGNRNCWKVPHSSGFLDKSPLELCLNVSFMGFIIEEGI
jgi:hypothetical protein